MKKMYSEIMDLEEEQKEYSLLCQGKSEKYRYYSDWRQHIEECLGKFQNVLNLSDFKHYCRNFERSSLQVSTSFLSYILFIVPIVLDEFIVEIPFLLLVAYLLFITKHILKKNNEVVIESYFFSDLIEVIEAVEAKLSQQDDVK